MKKWMNTIFFGSCFIAAVLIEAYSMQIFNGNLLSTTVLGIVVLITGYLFMDAIRNGLQQGRENVKFYMESMLNQEAEKLSERYTEMFNLQKATYTATKKNTALLNEQYEELMARIEKLENSNAKTLQRVIELQKKALEGQKTALNLEVNYNKENTKKIIGIIREELKKADDTEALAKIMELLERSQRQIVKMSDIASDANQAGTAEIELSYLKSTSLEQQAERDIVSLEEPDNEALPIRAEEVNAAVEPITMREADFARPINAQESNKMDGLVNLEEAGITDDSVNIYEAGMMDQSVNAYEAGVMDQSVNSYETSVMDNSANTSQADIAVNSVNSYGVGMMGSLANTSETGMMDSPINTYKADDMVSTINTYKTDDMVSTINTYKADDMVSSINTYDADKLEASDFEYDPTKENAPYSDWPVERESEPVAVYSKEEAVEEDKTVIPLYDDPNKTLTADEIAKLFASFGQ